MASTSPGNWACWSTLAKGFCEEPKGGTTQVSKLSESSGERGGQEGRKQCAFSHACVVGNFQDPRVRKSIKKENKENKEKGERAEKLREEEIVKSMNVFSNYGEKLFFLSYYFPKRANVQKEPVCH